MHLRVLLSQQRLHSLSPSTGLDGVRLHFRVEGGMFFFLWAWLVTSPMGLSALIHISLTVTALAINL